MTSIAKCQDPGVQFKTPTKLSIFHRVRVMVAQVIQELLAGGVNCGRLHKLNMEGWSSLPYEMNMGAKDEKAARRGDIAVGTIQYNIPNPHHIFLPPPSLWHITLQQLTQWLRGTDKPTLTSCQYGAEKFHADVRVGAACGERLRVDFGRAKVGQRPARKLHLPWVQRHIRTIGAVEGGGEVMRGSGVGCESGRRMARMFSVTTNWEQQQQDRGG
ncbi:hypothetical protein EDB19DRAFT_1827336 [Suillus lakei]|nr:hypothetical protein EDB19DRAFT_1827336 [Suillus lakei]